MSELMYEFRKISRGYLQMYDGVSEMLEKLYKQYTLIVASHTQGLNTDLELKELGIRKYFTNCVYFSDIGFKKTSDPFYQACLFVAQCEPDECVMVGDNLQEDVFMAHRSGIHTVWIINPATKDKFKAEVTPDAELPIEKIKNLSIVIQNICNHSKNNQNI